jgi:indole-3-glycerol phosphate synthase
MPTQLEMILAHTTLEVMDRRATADIPMLERSAAAHRPRGFEAALRNTAANGPAVIAELKKASPSRGLIKQHYQPAALAKSFEEAGAAALSVLTDGEFFQGSLADLERASAAVSIPCLRKDFIIDPFQILEARASGADAILLIVAALSDADLKMLFDEARRMGVEALCEVHDCAEIDRAAALGATLIGVNSRDLTTMEVRTETHFELTQWLPRQAVRVAESGVRNVDDIARLHGAGYDAFLVGEALMRQPDSAAALATLLDREYSSEV